MGPHKVVLFSTRAYDTQWFNAMNKENKVEIKYLESRLSQETVALAAGYSTVCCFVNDDLSKNILKQLKATGTKIIAMRCAGFNKVDLDACDELGLTVVRVPAYSPESVAEHAAAILQTLNRKIHKAYNRTRDGNFNLEGLCGMALYGKTVGVVGTGKIGLCAINIFKGYGMKILAHDIFETQIARDMGANYTDLKTLASQADVISLHCPLTPENKYLVGDDLFKVLKPGCLIVNTSRGGLVDTKAALKALKTGVLGGLAMDVYEEEEPLFFDDHSNEVIKDDTFRQLASASNVIVTGHQAFLTNEALEQIAIVTIDNVVTVMDGKKCQNEVVSENATGKQVIRQ
eukprot:Platyproteum_vivax@DN2449_c0_g1_i1.p1